MSKALDLIRGAARDMRRDGLLPCIHPRLQALSPCPEAAAWLVDAYNRRLLEYYVIALWSGANGHRAAYVIVKKILTDHPRRCGAIYAGPALARLGGAGAAADLLAVMRNHAESRSREGAARGRSPQGPKRASQEATARPRPITVFRMED